MWNTKQQKAIEYGNVIHEILSSIKSKDTIDFALEKALEDGLIQVLHKDETKKTIEKIVFNNELSPFFDWRMYCIERTNHYSKRRNHCKTWQDGFKKQPRNLSFGLQNGTHQTKYETQLNNYQKAIEKMGYKVSKKTLVYISDTIEVVNL